MTREQMVKNLTEIQVNCNLIIAVNGQLSHEQIAALKEARNIVKSLLNDLTD